MTHALRDAFFVARRSIQTVTKTRRAKNGTNATISIPSFTLPHWLPYTLEKRAEIMMQTNRDRPAYIICSYNIVQEILKLD